MIRDDSRGRCDLVRRRAVGQRERVHPFGHEQHEIVRVEILDLRRDTTLGEIRRRCAQDAFHLADRNRHQSRAVRCIAGDPQRDIERVVDQVHEPIGDRQLDVDLGMRARERRE